MSPAATNANANPRPAPDYDAVVVGAGFAGVYMLHRLRGLRLRARVYEAGSGIGGTWFWNRYPGARCDVESMEYSYQFSPELQQEWRWTEKYAPQPEILAYINHVADRYDLRADIQLDTRVTSAHYDEAARCWQVATSAGDRVTARFCIMATGCLSSANLPDIPGRDSFAGATYHTGNWPHSPVDFTGRRVGIIGTGSSAIQAIPIIARQAAHLTVFQRTANYSVPAHNGPMDPEHERRIKADYAGFWNRVKQLPFGNDLRNNDARALDTPAAEREREYEERWRMGGLPFMGAYSDLLLSREANETAADFLRRKIRALVQDPKVAELLTPHQTFGCKRLCVDTDYFVTYNRPNVTLVDVNAEPIRAITPAGLRAGDTVHAFDDLVFATGFDAMTGALHRIDIRGTGGRTLKDKWSAGPRTYLGLASAGFPNLFTITGPGSPSVLSNMLPSIEQHVNWIADCIDWTRRHQVARIEATLAAEDAWVEHVNAVAATTLFYSCNSWYLGANVPGKPRVFMPYIGVPPYVAKCEEVAAQGYAGFASGA